MSNTEITVAVDGMEFQNLPVEEKTPTQSPTWLSMLLSFIKTSTSETTQEDLQFEHLDEWEEESWEWVLSETENFLIEKQKMENVRITKELEELRKGRYWLKMKPEFTARARETFSSKGYVLQSPEAEHLQTTELDGGMRAAIVSECVEAFGPVWQQHLRSSISSQHSPNWKLFSESFEGTKYQKGIVGALKEVGWQASHGKSGFGLTPKLLGDITWSFWKSLANSVAWELGVDLSKDQLSELSLQVCACQRMILDLWSDCLKNRFGFFSFQPKFL